jgi:hypothetical protein
MQRIARKGKRDPSATINECGLPLAHQVSS